MGDHICHHKEDAHLCQQLTMKNHRNQLSCEIQETRHHGSITRQALAWNPGERTTKKCVAPRPGTIHNRKMNDAGDIWRD